MQRFRIYYAKLEALRYTGNLDVHKIWERSLRRAGLPVAYSQGFHPQPRIQQACPLPLGFLSQAEIVDIWLDSEDLTPEQVCEHLCTAVPAGISIDQVESVPDLYQPALQSRTISSDYRVELLDPVDRPDLTSRINALLDQPAVIRQRRGKEYDLRPLVLSLCLSTDQAGEYPALQMTLSAREGATGRPEEVLDELGIPATAARVTRTGLTYL